MMNPDRKIIEDTLIEELIKSLNGDYLQIARWIERNYGIKFGAK